MEPPSVPTLLRVDPHAQTDGMSAERPLRQRSSAKLWDQARRLLSPCYLAILKGRIRHFEIRVSDAIHVGDVSHRR